MKSQQLPGRPGSPARVALILFPTVAFRVELYILVPAHLSSSSLGDEPHPGQHLGHGAGVCDHAGAAPQVHPVHPGLPGDAIPGHPNTVGAGQGALPDDDPVILSLVLGLLELLLGKQVQLVLVIISGRRLKQQYLLDARVGGQGVLGHGHHVLAGDEGHLLAVLLRGVGRDVGQVHGAGLQDQDVSLLAT